MSLMACMFRRPRLVKLPVAARRVSIGGADRTSCVTNDTEYFRVCPGRRWDDEQRERDEQFKRSLPSPDTHNDTVFDVVSHYYGIGIHHEDLLTGSQVAYRALGVLLDQYESELQDPKYRGNEIEGVTSTQKGGHTVSATTCTGRAGREMARMALKEANGRKEEIKNVGIIDYIVRSVFDKEAVRPLEINEGASSTTATALSEEGDDGKPIHPSTFPVTPAFAQELLTRYFIPTNTTIPSTLSAWRRGVAVYLGVFDNFFSKIPRLRFNRYIMGAHPLSPIGPVSNRSLAEVPKPDKSAKGSAPMNLPSYGGNELSLAQASNSFEVSHPNDIIVHSFIKEVRVGGHVINPFSPTVTTPEVVALATPTATASCGSDGWPHLEGCGSAARAYVSPALTSMQRDNIRKVLRTSDDERKKTSTDEPVRPAVSCAFVAPVIAVDITCRVMCPMQRFYRDFSFYTTRMSFSRRLTEGLRESAGGSGTSQCGTEGIDLSGDSSLSPENPVNRVNSRAQQMFLGKLLSVYCAGGIVRGLDFLFRLFTGKPIKMQFDDVDSFQRVLRAALSKTADMSIGTSSPTQFTDTTYINIPTELKQITVEYSWEDKEWRIAAVKALPSKRGVVVPFPKKEVLVKMEN